MSSLSKSFRFTPILGGGLGTSNKVGKAPAGINGFFWDLVNIKCRIYSLNNPFTLLFQKEFKAFFNILRPGKQLAKTTKSCTRNSLQIVAIV